MVAEPEVLAASVESTSDRNVCPELALGDGMQHRPQPGARSTAAPHRLPSPAFALECLNLPPSPPAPPGPATRTFSGSEFHPV